MERIIASTTNVPSPLHRSRATLLIFAALCAIWRGELARASTLLDEGRALADATNDDRALAWSGIAAGQLRIWHGDFDAAMPPLADALERFRATGKPGEVIEALFRLGYAARYLGESDVYVRHGLAEARASGWHRPIAFAVEAMASLAVDTGEYRKSARFCTEALNLLGRDGDPGAISNCLKTVGSIAAHVGSAEQATRLLGASEAIWERSGGGAQAEFEQAYRDNLFAPARSRISEAEFARAVAAGRNLSLDDAITEGLGVASQFGIPLSDVPRSAEGLTAREKEVLRLLAAGRANQQIGEVLYISPRTAQSHITHLLAKLGLTNRTEAAAFAYRNGIG